MLRRWLALFCWCEITWTILTWTLTVEQVSVGVLVSAAVAYACAPLGAIAAPWALSRPRRAAALLALGAASLARAVRANLSLSRRIWSPSLPLRSGMVVVPTTAHTDGELTTVGLITSVIVDTQIVDLDLRRNELQYHVVWIDSTDPARNRRRINGPVEDALARANG